MDVASTALAPRTRDELRHWIESDLAAHGLNRWHAHYRLTHRIVYYQWLRRRAEYWRYASHDGHATLPARAVGALLAVRVRLLGERMGFTIPLGTTGPGLRLAHTGTIVVHVDSRIGAHCTLHQGVTIGEANGRIAHLGDHCHLAPNATVLGAHLGDHVGVWANAVVTTDRGSNISLAGIPARVVHNIDALKHERGS